MKNIPTLLVLVFFISSFNYGQEPYKYFQPKELEDGWETNSLKSQKIDTTGIYQLFDQIKNGKNRLHSIVLVKNNQLIIEEYFNGYSANQPHDLRSVSKSIHSILMGIAIDKQFIESIDDPISKYLKSPVPNKNLDIRKEKITIRHLLTMSSGWDCNDWDKKSKGQEDKVYKKRDWLQYTLNLPMVNEPGELSNYCSMGVVLIAEIISQLSGMTIQEFAQKYLFDPLEITNLKWGHTSNKNIILSGKRLYMIPRDMAKIGQLILNKGIWKNKQIVSQKWVETSTTPKTKITGIDYGYLWWNIPYKIHDNIVVSKTATGNGGQYIMVFPEMDLIAIFTGGAFNSQEDKLAFAIMNKLFLPLFLARNK